MKTPNLDGKMPRLGVYRVDENLRRPVVGENSKQASCRAAPAMKVGSQRDAPPPFTAASSAHRTCRYRTLRRDGRLESPISLALASLSAEASSVAV
jgi:hypothetical protein